MKKLLLIALACNVLSLQALKISNVSPEEQARIQAQREEQKKQFEAEQAAKEIAKKQYLPIAQEVQTALNSSEVQAEIQKFKDNVSANAKSIATTFAKKINLNEEQATQLNAILSKAYDLAQRIAEVGEDQSDEQLMQLQATLKTALEPLIYAIDDTFKIQQTLMSAAMQGKAPAAETVKSGAEQIAQIIQDMMNAIKAKSSSK